MKTSIDRTAGDRRRARRLRRGHPRRRNSACRPCWWKASMLGGTCLNIGCIPSKALIHAADEFEKARALRQRIGAWASGCKRREIDLAQTVRWKDGIVAQAHRRRRQRCCKKNGVQVVNGWATMVDGKTVDVHAVAGRRPLRINCEHLLLATGSVPVELPGHAFRRQRHLVDRSAGARAICRSGWWWSVPATSGWSWASPIASSARKSPWWKPPSACCPATTRSSPGRWWRRCKRLGVVLHLGCSVQGLTDNGAAVRVRSANADEFALPADRVLVAVGRKPRTEGFGLESLQLDMARPRHQDRRPVPHFDAQRLGHRRRDRRADAGPPRHGAGRDGGRDHRRHSAGASPRPRFPRCASPTRNW